MASSSSNPPPVSHSAGSSQSLASDLCDVCEPPVSAHCHGIGSHFHTDWSSIPPELAEVDHNIFASIYHDAALAIPSDKLQTMDAVSKCWRSVPTGCSSNLVHTPDGITWAIVEECVTQIPLEIQHALYFFHLLKDHIQDYSNYATPSANVELKRHRKNPKVVTKMLWNRSESSAASSSAAACVGNPSGAQGGSQARAFDIHTMMSERFRRQDVRVVTEIEPFKLRLAFTGASFVQDGVADKKLFAVLLVTFARNFDALSYINEVFVKKPAPQEERYAKKKAIYDELQMSWKRMVRFVAFHNLGLSESELGTPEKYAHDPGGILGVDSLFNVFQIPLQIYGSIVKSFAKGAGAPAPSISQLRICGLPQLAFQHGENMNDYCKYMYEHVASMQTLRRVVSELTAKYYAPKSKKTASNAGRSTTIMDSDELDDEDGEQAFQVPLPCMGGWPLEQDELGRVTKWGLPPLPIYLDFVPEFMPDAQGTFDIWTVEIGGSNGIPELTKACLRFFLVSMANSDESPSMYWDHFLTETQAANSSLVLQKYYGEKANPLNALIMAGYLRVWWTSFLSDVHRERREGRCSVLDAYNKLQRYLRSIILHHQSTVETNAYHSERISQAMHIIKKMDYASVAHSGAHSILQQVMNVRKEMSFNRRHSRYMVCNEMFFRTWETLNYSSKMNSSNLAFIVEMMVSQLFWMTGEHNTTWTAFFQGIQIKAGNGHFRVTTSEGVVDDHRKPNSTGMDWTHARLIDLYKNVMDRVGIADPKDNLQAPLNLSDWTPASIALFTSVCIVDDKIDSLPDRNMAYRDIIIPEHRKSATGVLVDVFGRNGPGVGEMKLNTCDLDQSNRRRSRIQVKTERLHAVGLCTNCNANEKSNEEFNTISVVIHTAVPGSGPYTKKQRVGAFNNQTCNSFGGRESVPENMDQIANVLCYSNIWMSCMGALVNKSGAIPWEINPAVLSYLDWMFFYVREHTEGLMHQLVAQSYRRMVHGYESRQVAKSIWMSAIRDIAFHRDSSEAIQHSLQNLHFHALALEEVPAAAHCFLKRGIHMGATLMAVACAKHLQAPILPIHQLCTFLNRHLDPSASAEDDQSTQALDFRNRIRTWLVHCLRRHRFCRDDNNRLTMYVSSDSDEGQNVHPTAKTMLRVARKAVFNNNVTRAVGQLVKELYGVELKAACHMGTEESIYGHAMHTMMYEWSPDFRQLYGNGLYDSRKHLEKLQLLETFQGVEDFQSDDSSAPPFAKLFETRNLGGEVVSYSIGINVWGLLLLVSMGLTRFHPHVVNDFARTILKDVLERSPLAATPGNTCLVCSFHVDTTTTQRIVLSPNKRPRHFLRPIGDMNFASTGTYTFGKSVGVFMPEDIMHCGFLFNMCKTFQCSVFEIPGRTVPCEYEILADVWYLAWNCLANKHARLLVNSMQHSVTLYVFEDEEETTWTYDNWTTELRRSDFTIMPMIFRAGACVQLADSRVGLIVPFNEATETNETKWANFDHETCSYHIERGPDEPTAQIPAIETLRTLIACGTSLFVNLRDTEYLQHLLPRVPPRYSTLYWLSVRLNVPTVAAPDMHKVYVTYVQKPSSVHASASTFSTVTIAVRPEDLRTAMPDADTDFVTALVMPPAAGAAAS